MSRIHYPFNWPLSSNYGEKNAATMICHFEDLAHWYVSLTALPTSHWPRSPNFSSQAAVLHSAAAAEAMLLSPLTQSDSHTFAHLRSLNSSADEHEINMFSWKYKLHHFISSKLHRTFSITQSHCWWNDPTSLPNVQTSTDTMFEWEV